MAFPGVSSSNSGVQSATSNHTINLPSNIAAGNLLMIFFTGHADNIGITTPSGWTLLRYTGTPRDFAVFYKVATGDEGSTLNLVTNNNVYSAHVTYRITSYSGTPEISDTATGVTGSPNPQGLTAAGGAKDYMWIAVGASGAIITSAPTNYTDNVLLKDTAGLVSLGVATRNLNAETEDPSSFANSSGSWSAFTLAISPDATLSSPSPSTSPSASRSPSASSSASMSPSASRSPSASLSPSSSTSQSTSPSASMSPSASRSPSSSMSPSASLSPSSSSSVSMSPSASLSPSSSTSPSSSSSLSQSPSASPSAPDWDEQTLHTSTFTKQTISFH